MIWKVKVKQSDLDSDRFIHCKSWLPRDAESLVVEGGLKGTLIEGFITLNSTQHTSLLNVLFNFDREYSKGKQNSQCLRVCS